MFQLFPNLPYEIRAIIWSYIAHEPRALSLAEKDGTPAMLHVSNEARREGFNYYRTGRHGYVNLVVDTIRIDEGVEHKYWLGSLAEKSRSVRSLTHSFQMPLAPSPMIQPLVNFQEGIICRLASLGIKAGVRMLAVEIHEQGLTSEYNELRGLSLNEESGWQQTQIRVSTLIFAMDPWSRIHLLRSLYLEKPCFLLYATNTKTINTSWNVNDFSTGQENLSTAKSYDTFMTDLIAHWNPKAGRQVTLQNVYHSEVLASNMSTTWEFAGHNGLKELWATVCREARLNTVQVYLLSQ